MAVHRSRLIAELFFKPQITRISRILFNHESSRIFTNCARALLVLFLRMATREFTMRVFVFIGVIRGLKNKGDNISFRETRSPLPHRTDALAFRPRSI